jgi:hypothetical protein
MDRIEGKLTKKFSVVRLAPTLVVRDSTRGRGSIVASFSGASDGNRKRLV